MPAPVREIIASQARRQKANRSRAQWVRLWAQALAVVVLSPLLLDAPVKVELSSNEIWEPQNYDERFRGRVEAAEAVAREAGEDWNALSPEQQLQCYAQARLREANKADFLAREGVKLSYLPFFAKAAIQAMLPPPDPQPGREIAPGVREVVFPDGAIYRGAMRGTSLHGKGEYVSKEFKYQGDFRDGLKQGEGVYVWDVDGNEFIEYGMGLRSVTLGHAFPPVIAAAAAEMQNGTITITNIGVFGMDTGTPILKMDFISIVLALAEPVPFTLASLMTKSFTRSCVAGGWAIGGRSRGAG